MLKQSDIGYFCFGLALIAVGTTIIGYLYKHSKCGALAVGGFFVVMGAFQIFTVLVSGYFDPDSKD
jgi:uncharacterized membrane protein HdeD (DUF308 family)